MGRKKERDGTGDGVGNRKLGKETEVKEIETER